jgi:hypothetical protein
MRLQFSSTERALEYRDQLNQGQQLNPAQQLNLARQRSAHAPWAPGTVSKDDQ